MKINYIYSKIHVAWLPWNLLDKNTPLYCIEILDSHNLDCFYIPRNMKFIGNVNRSSGDAGDAATI